jgi:predicted amidohydrolase YtcJ
MNEQSTHHAAPLTIFKARRIITMDPSLPEATAAGVIDGRIVAVGDMASMAPWREGRRVIVDERLADKVLMPGFIENHLHPFLGALLTPMEVIAPEAWRLEGGRVAPAATTPEQYRALLEARLAARTDHSDWFISFGYQPSEHGVWGRAELDALCPDRPVILWQRSFHETYMNSSAIAKLGLDELELARHPQIDLARGHFYETGNKVVVAKLMPRFLRPDWYYRGLNITADLMQRGGITTAADMLFGALDPDYEIAALRACIEEPGRPLRVVNVADARSFANRAAGRAVMGGPDQPIDFSGALPVIEALQAKASPRVKFLRAVKLFADGAMFSQLMQMNPPGYIDGHQGEWLMSPEVLASGVEAFWNADYQIHVHVNGDGGMDAVLNALAGAQSRRPRFDHRFMMHHVGFHTNAQSTRMAALGAHASVNSYYIHALADGYARLGLGPERASQIVRAGSMKRAGLKVSFHSDFMMAPLEPLTLAWCAATRTTRSGARIAPEERVSLDEALAGITIDAAFGLGLDHEIGSISCGKKADFTVLEDDPYDLGGERLREVRVAGTVFEGEVHLLATPASSVTLSDARRDPPARPRTPKRSAAPRYRMVAGGCVADGDPCVFMRQLPGLAAQTLRA